MENRESIKGDRLRLAAELYDRQLLEQKVVGLIELRAAPEHDDWRVEPEINARTALFEELTAKGHLSHVEFDESPEVSNERALRRLVNGWSDQLPIWETERRQHEIVEELTIRQVWEDIKAGALPADTIVITISDFPEICPDDFAPKIGYRALNKKGMVRVTEFCGGKRIVEQISRSNSNDGSSEAFFADSGFVVGKGSARVLASQVIATKRDFPNGVVDVQRSLDTLAGPGILYGEDGQGQNPTMPEYADLRRASAAREHQAERFIKLLAEHETALNYNYKSGKITYAEKLSSLNKRRRQLVDEICLLDPSYALDARGAVAVPHYENASLAMAAGDHVAGMAHLERAVAATDSSAGVVCGGEATQNRTTGQPGRGAGQTYLEALLEKKNWKWKRGVCVIKECPTRPAKIEIGPCSVCHKCQTIFDKGKNPRSVYKAAGFWETIIRSLAA